MKSMNRCAPIAMLLFFAAVAFTAGPASAGPRPGPMQDTQERWLRGPHPQRALAGWTADLTEDQVARLRQLRRDFRAETRDLRRELRQRRLALAAELAKKVPDAAKAGRIQKSISALRTELAQQRLQHLLQAKQVAPELGLSRLWRRGAFNHRR
ncbi:MAG TPA: periplasmic heavy metal sensor [Desulfobacteraceae bacterium]|nr:periplasmic heavy metal sensor [Deltaproteobacteria bacterium]MBW2356813.1 periplasmic heavy metal sensor [Deltaproteobacteria bacterium]HDI58945.1 periplasmic heavy metal sensor [Desulfobacteraceae bacterium]